MQPGRARQSSQNPKTLSLQNAHRRAICGWCDCDAALVDGGLATLGITARKADVFALVKGAILDPMRLNFLAVYAVQGEPPSQAGTAGRSRSTRQVRRYPWARCS